MTEDKAGQHERRFAILKHMEHAGAYMTRLVREGALVLAAEPLQQVVAEYDVITREALSLFRQGEEEVAWWAQVELYAGIAEPLTLLRKGLPLTVDGALSFTPPRSFKLESWATGDSLGPRFRGQDSTAPQNVDTFREEFVVPFSEAPEDMVWAPILDWRANESSISGE